MRLIQLLISGLREGVELVEPLLPQITGAFRPYGFDIQTSRGQILTEDPANIRDGWQALLDQLHQQSRAKTPAHLVVTKVPPDDGMIDGMLLDPEIRGVVAIYLGAHIFQTAGGPDEAVLCQVCVHELGHLLDLTHKDGSSDTYANAMLPASMRQGHTPDQAWEMAIADMQSRREEIIRMPSGPAYYPFGAQARACLRAAMDDISWLPFQSRFRGLYDENGATADTWHPHHPSGTCCDRRPAPTES